MNNWKKSNVFLFKRKYLPILILFLFSFFFLFILLYIKPIFFNTPSLPIENNIVQHELSLSQSFVYGEGGVAIDTNGFVYLAGSGTFRFEGQNSFLLKYDSTGTLIWSQTWSGLGVDEMDVDANGSIYVITGYRERSLKKFDANGTQLWNRELYEYEENNKVWITVDANGSIYLVGRYPDYYDPVTNNTLLTKFDSGGDLLWNLTWAGSVGEHCYGITADANNSVYLTGISYSCNRTYLAKFNSIGNELWYRTVGTSNTYQNDVVVDKNGSLYFTGSIGMNAFLTKYDFEGNQIWYQQLTDVDGDSRTRIAVNNNGTIYFAGTERYPSNKPFLIKCNPVGNISWIKYDFGSYSGVVVDNNGSIYLSGTAEAYGKHAFLVKYDTDGNQFWYQAWGETNPPSWLWVKVLIATAAIGSTAMVVYKRDNPKILKIAYLASIIPILILGSHFLRDPYCSGLFCFSGIFIGVSMFFGLLLLFISCNAFFSHHIKAGFVISNCAVIICALMSLTGFNALEDTFYNPSYKYTHPHPIFVLISSLLPLIAGFFLYLNYIKYRKK